MDKIEENRAKSREYYHRVIKNNPVLLTAQRERVKYNVWRWRNRNPEKVKAQRLVFSAVRNGTLKRVACFCGKKGEAHHKDYSKPLDIVWLCKIHHRERDRIDNNS